MAWMVLVMSHLFLHLHLSAVLGVRNGEYPIGGYIMLIVGDQAFKKLTLLEADEEDLPLQTLFVPQILG
jgi:hypothetical protein